MTHGTDADFLQVLLRQVREDRLVGLVIAERRFILTKAKFSEPCPDIDGRALAGHGAMIVQAGQGV
jgi:hypothetical protein